MVKLFNHFFGKPQSQLCVLSKTCLANQFNTQRGNIKQPSAPSISGAERNHPLGEIRTSRAARALRKQPKNSPALRRACVVEQDEAIGRVRAHTTMNKWLVKPRLKLSTSGVISIFYLASQPSESRPAGTCGGARKPASSLLESSPSSGRRAPRQRRQETNSREWRASCCR